MSSLFLYKSKIASILFLISFPLVFLGRVDEAYVTIAAYTQTLIGLITICFLIKDLYKKDVLFRRAISIWLGISSVFILNFLLLRNFEFKNLLVGTVIMPSISFIIYFYEHKKWILYLPFLCVLSMIVYRWFILGLDAEEITVNSRNYIVFYLFLYFTPIVLSNYKNNDMPSVVFPIAFLVLAIIAIGRGSIIISVTFFVGWLLNRIQTSSHKKILFVTMVCIIAPTIYALFMSEDADLLFSRFEERGMESHQRTDAWYQYIDYTFNNLFNLILGTKVSTVPYVRALENSLHNSYLTVHARMGIVGLWYLSLVYKGYKSIWKSRNYLVLSFFGALLFKGLVDADFPCVGSGGDIYIYILILLGLDYKYSKKYTKYESKSNCTLSSSVSSDTRE